MVPCSLSLEWICWAGVLNFMFVNWFAVDNLLCSALSLFWGGTLTTMSRPCVGDEVAQLVGAPWLTVANRHTPSPWPLTGSEPNQCP